MKRAAAVLFFAAALASTGCGQNALVNPVVDDQATVNGQTVQAGRQLDNPGRQLDMP
jgi:hypothetical protein